MNWTKPRDCEAGHCPEVAVIPATDMIAIRSTLNPQTVLLINQQEWRAMVAEMRNSAPFGVQ